MPSNSQKMKCVGNCLVGDEIGVVEFVCDLDKCKGACCIEGDAGAPILESEVGEIEDALDAVKPYMTEKGRQEVEANGILDWDAAGNMVTPLVEGRECVFAVFDGDIALCAIEQAYNDGKTTFKKPISCHLYPIRVTELFEEEQALNYHKWQICKPALKNGKKLNVPLYIFLKEPLVRAYGEQWYKDLEKEFENE